MRPDPIANRSFFREEAERFRQRRHLGEIALFRPLSLRLVTLYPVLVSALLVLAATQVELRPKFTAVLTEHAPHGAMNLSLPNAAAAHVAEGDAITLRLDASEHAVAGTVTALSSLPCGDRARLVFAARGAQAPRTCLHLSVELAPGSAANFGEEAQPAELWASAQPYLSYLLHR